MLYNTAMQTTKEVNMVGKYGKKLKYAYVQGSTWLLRKVSAITELFPIGREVTDKEIAEAFKIARERIADDSYHYICLALKYKSRAGKVAVKVIEERLGDNCCSYEGWMYRHHPELSLKMQPKDFKEGRLQWLDSLIEEFSNNQH